MKSCPECKSIYHDDSLNYCLSDGKALDHYIDSEKTLESNNFKDYISKDFSEHNFPTIKNETTDEKSKGSVWKYTTFGLFGFLVISIVSLYIVSPERFEALGSYIPLPKFGFASGKAENESDVSKNDASTKNLPKITSKRTNIPKPGNVTKNSDEISEGVAGNWKMSLVTPRGNFPLYFDLYFDEEGNVVGESNSPFGKEKIKVGKFENGVLTLKLTRPTTMLFKGNVKGTSISGNVVTEIGTTTFTGDKISSSEYKKVLTKRKMN